MLLAALRAGPASRAALASRTGLTRATVASLLDPLVRVGVLVEETAAPAGPGRPARPVGFGPRSPVAVGVSIEVDAVVAGASGLDGVSAGRRRVPRDHRALTADAIYAGAAEVAAGLAAELGRPVLGTGLALPALLSGTPDDTVVVRAPNLPALDGTRPTLSPAPAPTPRRVLVGNEATFGALAHLDVAPDLIYVSADVGIGGGLVVDGRVLRGTRGFAGEIGHVVVEPDGPACGCGGRGCVEQFAGRDALLATSGCADLAALRRALERGEPSAVEAVRRAGTALGVGLSSVVNVVDLPVVVLGGLFAELVPHLLPAVEAELATRCMGHPPERVVASRHGDAATVRGAAEAVLAEVLADPDRLLEVPDPARVRMEP
ncbi:ROK family protein [Pseudonocardia sp. WMMC193]|uniref:ROK family protein n=1 Tax=Pseudonocardia sp. WMMC193 TaxID=2911965 RepID=UPI001F3AE092|nr:ROK family protein [Pseudonocardia sp. WMMC193]MCF7549930.1 ROK family protein [Pseudonocardia sp. WMMC193]